MSSSEPAGIAIFASGTGSNALKIIEHFAGHPRIRVRAIFCNNLNAGVLGHAFRHHIPSVIITRRLLDNEELMQELLAALKIDRIVLAGFLLLIPGHLVRSYHHRIVNIHPALLPRYGGKGMYGMRVHEAVLASGESETGITIHLVNEHYDEGKVLFQKSVALEPADTPESVAQKVHALEHEWYPKVIEEWLGQ